MNGKKYGKLEDNHPQYMEIPLSEARQRIADKLSKAEQYVLLFLGFLLLSFVIACGYYLLFSHLHNSPPYDSNNSDLQTIITLDHYQGTFSSAINEIAKQANLNSSVSHELLNKQLEIDIHGQSAEFVLNNLCLEFKCAWEVENESINVYNVR